MDSFPCLVVTGSRQAGKTTLIKHVFPDHNFASLDLPSRAEKADKSAELFLQEFPPPVVVDEIQYAPGLFRQIKREIDFLEIRDGRMNLFEVKWTGTSEARWLANLKEGAGLPARSKVYGPGDRYLLCRTPSSFEQAGVQVIHPSEFFAAG